MRRNWGSAQQEDPSIEPSKPGERGLDNGALDPETIVPKEGWERVEQLLERTADVLLTAPSPEVLAELAAKWCEVEPVPRETQWGDVRVCYLYPPVRVKGIALTLELSDSGIVGFVASELDAQKSRELVVEARRALAHLCEHSWAIATAGLDIQTCTVDGGSTLAVGRLQPRPDDDRWQVSVAFLGAI